MSGLRNLGKKYSEHHAWKLRRLVFWGAIVVVFAIVVVAAAFYFDEFTEGGWFCGVLCHPNRPQGITHEESPHASVECGTCHIGPGLWPKVEAKILGIGELVALFANSYERPLEAPVERLDSAEVMCEQCHWAEMAYPDRVNWISSFADDEANTETQTVLTMRIAAEGPTGESGAHWHIENSVWYAATDHVNQEIPWVAVENADGSLTEYVAKSSTLSVDELMALPRQEMDCLDCHNRAAHEFRKPESELDGALADARIDVELPFVKREAMTLLSGEYATQPEGIERMADLASFYESTYPEVYASKSEEIQQAVEVLEEIYHTTVFPDMNLTWDVYADNRGHIDFPGCFRCHDGQHTSAEGDAITRSCVACHSLPSTPSAQQPASAPSTAVSAEAPAIPHALEGMGQCLACHREGGGLPVPSNHAVYSLETCTSCHGQTTP